MKRSLSLLLALALLCALLAGCAGKTEPDAPVIDPAPPTAEERNVRRGLIALRATLSTRARSAETPRRRANL